jgi:hypothetical protein
VRLSVFGAPPEPGDLPIVPVAQRTFLPYAYR